jgi:hypothetical protein
MLSPAIADWLEENDLFIGEKNLSEENQHTALFNCHSAESNDDNNSDDRSRHFLFNWIARRVCTACPQDCQAADADRRA